MSILAQFMNAEQPHLQAPLPAATSHAAVVRLSDLVYQWPGTARPLLHIQALDVEKGQRVFVQGASGSGKTTLLSLLAGIVTPQQGIVSVLGRSVSAMTGVQRDRFRADHIGFIFQMFNLIPYLSVMNNVLLAAGFGDADSRTLRSRADELLEAVKRGNSGALQHELGVPAGGLSKRDRENCLEAVDDITAEEQGNAIEVRVEVQHRDIAFSIDVRHSGQVRVS